MEPPFTLADLRHMATPNSFSRGQDYYDQGAVRELTYDGEQYSARVRGSFRYQITISGTHAEPHLYCSCPYDYGGICKHLVAVGLAILEGEAETGATIYEEATLVEEPAVSLSQFPSLFEQTTDAVKLRFLRQILDQNTALRAQFAKYAETYAGSLVTTEVTSATETLENVREEVALHLESLTFDEDELFSPGYYENGGYYDESADADRNARRIIREVLEPYERKIRQRWQGGELASGTAVLLGLYEGKSSVTEPAHDPLGILSDYTETVGEVLTEVFAELFATLDRIVKSSGETRAAADLLLARYQQYDVSVRELRSQQAYVFYQLRDFQPFLIGLADTVDHARFLLSQLQKQELIDVDTAGVLLHIAQQLDDDALWVSTAEDFAPYELEIARQLLDRYQTTGRSEDFVRVAQQTFEQFPDQIDEYLASYLPDGSSPALYKKVHLHLVRRLHRLDYYRVIRPHLNEAEKNDLLQDPSLTYDDEFYVQLLAVEDRYADILKRVQQRTYADQYLDRLLEPILSVYPNECYTLLHRKCQEAVSQRGRGTYRLIARWLQLMQRIAGREPETADLIADLYHHKPNLPALKDEMRRAGVTPA